MAAGSSESVVELCTLADAELDAATSAKFFRDDDGPGGAISSFSWPEAGRTSSRLFDQSALQALCEKYKVPAEYTPVCLDGRWMACQTPPEDTIFVYADALEAGMRIPLHDFYVEVLGHYGLAPSQLEPDAWRYMAAFLMLSMDAGVEPSLPAFRSFFSICTHDGGSVGWHHFRSRPGSCLFNVKVPGSPDPEWKSRFFLLRSPSTRPSPWPCAVKWGKPSKAAVRMPVVTGDTDMVMKKLQDSVMLFLSRSRLSLPVAPPQVDLTITPQQKHELVKVGAAGAAAAEPPPPPTTTTTQEPTRKRRSFSDTHTLVDSIAEALELAKTAMAEIDEQGNELLATRAEVALLKEALAEVRRLADEASTKHIDKVKDLQKQHAAAVARLKEEHAADVAGVKDAADKEVRETKKKIVLRLFPKLDVSLLDLEGPKLKGDPDAAGTPKGE